MLQEHFSAELTTWQFIHAILRAARQSGNEGPVARHLLGASLQLAFPNIPISNDSYSTAVNQSGRQGDFHVGDTVFHVMVAPTLTVYERCKRVIDDGFGVYLLVPDRFEAGARQNAEITAPGQIPVQSIESFVAQTVDELSAFSMKKLIEGLRRLLETYNQRVDSIENDKSMLIEIPKNLLP